VDGGPAVHHCFQEGDAALPRSFSREGAQYPWGLEFSWIGVDGADHYEVEVAEGPINDYSTLIFPTVCSAHRNR
jgi:hypothetical protein